MTDRAVKFWPGHRWILIGIAVFGGLVAAGGFVWVGGASGAYGDDSLPSAFGYSSAPGTAAFTIGSVILFGAFLVVRLRVRPSLGGHIIWACIGVAWVAIAMNCYGTATTNSVGGPLELLIPASFLVGYFAEFVFVFGVAFVLLRWMDRTERPRTTSNTRGGRRRWIVIGIATGFAVFAGIVTLVGYNAVVAFAAARVDDTGHWDWNVVWTNSGATAYTAGFVVLLSALLTIRLRVRPRSGGRILWASLWIFWLGNAVICLGQLLITDPSSSIGFDVILLSFVIGMPAFVFLIFGITVIIGGKVSPRPQGEVTAGIDVFRAE
jgi:MFS family permease